MEQSEPNVIFRRAKNRAAMRKPTKPPSSASNSDDNDVDARTEEFSAFTSTAQKRRQLRQKKMVHTTSKKKRTQLDALGASSSSDEPDEVVGSHTDDIDVKFASSRTAELSGPGDMGATARSEIDTEYDRDAQAQFERIQKMLREQGPDAVDGTSSEKVYRGLAFYGAKAKEDTVKGSAASGLNRVGPIRATQYMRSSVRWDYAPDICKDYKETGYCTFGDSCKFMHDRSDYKHGWQLEREWEQGKFKESKEDEYLVSSEAENSDDDNLPFHCYICRESFKNPVITKCKHYFCEICALNRCKKTKKCAVCNANTEGQFAVAKAILSRIGSKEKKEKEDQEDEEASDTDSQKVSTENSMKFLPVQNDNSEELLKVKNEAEDNVSE